MTRGPIPLALEQRQRSSRAVTRSTLRAAPVEAPRRFPRHPEGEYGDGWHPEARRFWEELWASPMAAEYIDADMPGLTMLLYLVDQPWHRPSTKLAAEVRHWMGEYGLSPVARRRLQWSVVRVTHAAQRPGQSTKDRFFVDPDDDTDSRLQLRERSIKERLSSDPRAILRALDE